MIQETSDEKLFHWVSTQTQQKLPSKFNGEARHKLDLSRCAILEFSDLKFGTCWLGWLGFLFSQPYSYIKLILKSHHTVKLRPRIHILCMRLLRLYALGFYNQVFPDLHRLWSKKLFNQQQSIKLLELITYWNPCKGVSHRLKIYARKKERSLLQDQVQLVIRAKVQLYVGILE